MDNQEAVIKLPTKQKRAIRKRLSSYQLNKNGHEIRRQEIRRQKVRPFSKNGPTSYEKKTLDQLYLKGPESFGNQHDYKPIANCRLANIGHTQKPSHLLQNIAQFVYDFLDLN